MVGELETAKTAQNRTKFPASLMRPASRYFCVGTATVGVVQADYRISHSPAAYGVQTMNMWLGLIEVASNSWYRGDINCGAQHGGS